MRSRRVVARDAQLALIAARAGFVRAARRLEERRAVLLAAAQSAAASEEPHRLFRIAADLGPAIAHAIDQAAAVHLDTAP